MIMMADHLGDVPSEPESNFDVKAKFGAKNADDTAVASLSYSYEHHWMTIYKFRRRVPATTRDS